MALSHHLKGSPTQYEVLTARHVAPALELATTCQPDVIIASCTLPNQYGMALLKRVKTHPQTEHIPVVLLTEDTALPDKMRQAMTFGAADCLPHDITPEKLLVRLAWLNKTMDAYLTMLQQKMAIQAQQQQLETQQARQLMVNALEVKQKEDTLLMLKQQLTKIATTAQPVTAMLLKQLVKQIGQATAVNHQWDTFKQYFEQSHPGFLHNLQRHCPQLSEQDVRLCVYLTMRMSNHEIAQLKHISIESVRTQKYRIKKKLGLHKNQALTEFLWQYAP